MKSKFKKKNRLENQRGKQIEQEKPWIPGELENLKAIRILRELEKLKAIRNMQLWMERGMMREDQMLCVCERERERATRA